MPRPDVFAQAVKEQYPQICEIPGIISQGKQGKQSAVDKNFAANMQARYSNVEQSPFTQKMIVKFEPRIPGNYVELYTSKGANVALRLSAKATLPLCHIECEPNNYLETQRPSSMPTPYVFS